MPATCHRCQGDLPDNLAGGTASSHGYDPQLVLFCPHCSAPQLRLQEHMVLAPAGAGSTTGAVPPPHPSRVQWRIVLAIAAILAAITALLKVLAFVFAPAAYLATVWIGGAAVLAVSLYAQRAPQARVDARAGSRIGFATGMLTIGAIALAFALTGLVARFGLHRMTGVDVEISQQFAQMHAQLDVALPRAAQQPPAPDWERKLVTLFAQDAPETRAGYVLFSLGLGALLVLLLSTAGGAFAGLLQAPRRRPRSPA